MTGWLQTDNAALDEFRLELGDASEIGLTISIVTIMFAVALTIRPEHFRFFKDRPRVYLAGVFGQLVALPLLALALSYLLNPHPSLALGMFVVACCPGGNVSNLLSLFARGNTALSVSLTATSSLFAALLTPVSILFWSHLYPPTAELLTRINIDAIDFLIRTLLVLAVPLVVGMWVAAKFPKLAKRLTNPFSALGGVLMALITIIAFLKYFDVFLALGFPILLLVILFNLLAFIIGYVSAKAVRADTASRRAITLEVGIQNVGLAIVILINQFDGVGGAAAVAGMWGTWHILAGAIFVLLFRWKDRRAHV